MVGLGELVGGWLMKNNRCEKNIISKIMRPNWMVD